MSKNTSAAIVSDLLRSYPSLRDLPITENLFSTAVVELPKQIFTTAEKAIRAFHQLRLSANFKAQHFNRGEELFQFDPGHFSVMMGYDFHVTPQGPKLIEINTNAAFSLGVLHLQKIHQLSPGLGINPNYENDMLSSFKEEYKFFGASDELKHLSLIDSQPEKQKLYLEFLMFKSALELRGCQVSILDSLQIDPKKPLQLVYNRDTDFLLRELSSLKQLYLQRRICLSPNPHEYLLLADKRLLTHPLAKAVEDINNVLPPSLDLSEMSEKEVWDQRKNFVFKPTRSFGSKAVYRGDGVTRRVFSEIMANAYIAQYYVRPSEVTVKVGETSASFKYDLRFYVYQDRIQLVGARLYKGQMTNLQTLGGGFAPVVFS